MAFNFGNTSQLGGFGSTPAKPAGFGTNLTFGQTPTTSTTGFGGLASTFGTPAATQNPAPAFGSTFGQPAAAATSAAPAFGSSFGTPQFGSTFGTPAASSAPAFGSTFGTPATSTAPGGFGLFGSTTTSQAAPPAFGSTFGTPATTSAAPVFGTTFGAPATSTAPSLFGSSFGTTPAVSAPNLFGSTPGTGLLFGGSSFGTATTTATGFPTATSAPMFSGYGTTTSTTPFGAFGTTTTAAGTGFGCFGATTTTTPSLFGSAFGAKPATTSTGFGGFGSTLGGGLGTLGAPGTLGTFNQPSQQQQQQQAPPANPYQAIYNSIYAINIFGDERDAILQKWNLLQASWGTGKGYYSQTQPPVEYTPSNPFCRFRGVGYAAIPERDNAEGLVKIFFNKKDSDIRNQQDQLVTGINGVLGNKPNLSVAIEQVKGLSDNQTEVVLTVSERGVTGTSRKIPASELAAFLNQPMQKQQLMGTGVTFIGPYIAPDKVQLAEYLKTPPLGVNPQAWQIAQDDNPNPEKLMPAPINGFSDLKKRMLCQEYETGLHKAFLEKVSTEIIELKKRHAATIAQIAERKQKFSELQHRILKVLVKQEVTRKIGMALQPEEEHIKGQLETMYSQIMIPTQCKGQLHEMKALIQMQGTLGLAPQEKYSMDSGAQEDIKQFLQMEQNGITYLVDIIKNDLKNLKIISDGMNTIIQKK